MRTVSERVKDGSGDVGLVEVPVANRDVEREDLDEAREGCVRLELSVLDHLDHFVHELVDDVLAHLGNKMKRIKVNPTFYILITFYIFTFFIL